MKKILILSIAIIAIGMYSCKKEDTAPEPASYLFYAGVRDSLVGKVDLKNGNAVSEFAKGAASGINYVDALGLALNSENGDIYLSIEDNPGTIYRISSNGVVSTVYAGALANSPAGIAYNPANDKVYWCNSGNGKIYSINADGTGTPTALYGGADVNAEYGLEIDDKNGKLYFTDFNEIFSGNLDGSGTPSVLYASKDDTISSPSSLILDVDNNRIYWTDESTDVVASANLDGSGNFKILYNNAIHGVDRSDGLAIDFVAGKIYWSETGSTERIRVGNLDGTGTPVTLVNIETYHLLLK